MTTTTTDVAATLVGGNPPNSSLEYNPTLISLTDVTVSGNGTAGNPFRYIVNEEGTPLVGNPRATATNGITLSQTAGQVGTNTVNVVFDTKSGTPGSPTPAVVLGYDANFVLIGSSPNVDVPGTYFTYNLITNNAALFRNPATYPITDLVSSSAAPLFTPPAPFVPCFVTGTLVLTANGEVPVEEVAVGDVLPGVDGDRTVIWVGRRHVSVARHANPDAVRPVRILAGAFADGLPRRDLVVSPDHAFLIDGVFAQAKTLVNGATIIRDMAESVLYVHIETDIHTAIFAEGVPAETLLSVADRGQFDRIDGVIQLNPDFGEAATVAAYDDRGFAPLALDSARVEPIWRRLADRAATLGHPIVQHDVTDRHGLHLIVAGIAVEPSLIDGGRHVFALPSGTETVRLVSRSARPSDTRPWLVDRRALGVSVSSIVTDAGAIRLDGSELLAAAGWHGVEVNGATISRWTNGDAWLSVPAGATTLEIQVVASVEYPVDQLSLAA